jgi:2-polyprenyl-6-methoxyphenol hydroxylase-like FAD-dependent oxidoreductase
VSVVADLLVVGAGPSGLALALQAHDHGARVRIVERRAEAFRPSRALIVHPRTLEVLRPLGVTDAILARADTAPAVALRLGRRVVRVRLDGFALPDTAFPHLTLVRQTDVESVLARALADRGVAVEWNTELIAVETDTTGARATLRSPTGTETAEAAYVVGCDGPGSTVRRCAGVAWPGGPYGEEVVLADLELDAKLADGVTHAAAGRRGLLLVFALGERATWRLLATRPAGCDSLPFGQPGPPVPAGELQVLLEDAGLDARITDLAWSARYRLQHRLATRFRQGRLFLVGDAAHAYSPATGQGMNTGIQDALNLGWKLAFSQSATDPAALLDSYERERRPVVRRALAVTHLAFWAEASPGPLPALLRGVVGPLVAPVIPALAGRRRLLGVVLRVVSQLRAAYGDSELSTEGRPRLTAGPRPGQRLPDATVTVGGQRVRLHALLATPAVHVLLDRDASQLEFRDFGPHVVIHRLTSAPGTGLVAVRPDGYVGFRCGAADASQLRDWLERIGATAFARRLATAPTLPLTR